MTASSLPLRIPVAAPALRRTVRRPLMPVDLWVALANLLFAFSWLIYAGQVPLARWFVGVHVAALGLPWLLARITRPLTRAGRLLRAGYPLLWVVAFWNELGLRTGLVPMGVNDRLIAGLDAALFGGQQSLTWHLSLPLGWFASLMDGAYFVYYPLLVGVPIILLLRGCQRTAEDMVLRIAVTYLGIFCIYAAFPVLGPRTFYGLADIGGGGAHGLTEGLRAAGDSLGTAFPSSHVAGSLTLAWVAWRAGHTLLRWVATPVALLVPFATVYTGNHFVLDAVAGVVLTLLLQWKVVPMLQRAAEARSLEPGTTVA